MYDTAEELLREIDAGEDSFLDLKEVAFKDRQVRFLAGGSAAHGKATVELAKDLTCFANTEGGVIVFGVRDDGAASSEPDAPTPRAGDDRRQRAAGDLR